MQSKKLLSGIAIGAVSFFLGIGSSFAAVTQLSNSSGLLLVNDFESSLNNASVTFSAGPSLAAASSWTNSVTASGSNGIAGPDPIIGTLSSSATAIGMWFGNDDFGLSFNAILEVYSGATLLGSVSVLSNANDYADQFIGLSSDTAFDSFHIRYQRPQAQGLYVFIDDLYVGNANRVPEPATLTLLGVALAGLAARRSKKQ